MDIQDKLKDLKPMDLNCNIFSVYDYNGYTIQEILNVFFTKLNECVESTNKTLELLEWLFSIGLKKEVAEKLNSWLEDGTLAEIINEEIFAELNTKINDLNTKLDEKILEVNNDISTIKNAIDVNASDFGAVGDKITDDWQSIQNAIDYVASKGGGNVRLNTGRYKITKPLVLSTYVNLIGTGTSCEIYKVKGGLTLLDNEKDYKTATREDMLMYDACIVTVGSTNYIRIENLHLGSYDENNKVQWGMLTPFISISSIKNVSAYHFDEGMRHFISWNMFLEGLRFRFCNYGVRLESNGTKRGGSTSWTVNRIGIDYCNYGFKLVDLHYCSLNCLTVDNNDGRAYWFTRCSGISINGMGYEASYGQIMKLEESQVAVTGFKSLWSYPIKTRPEQMEKDVLIEVQATARIGYGLTFKTAEFYEDSSQLHKLYISPQGTVIAENIRFGNGKPFNELEPTSEGHFYLVNEYETYSNRPMKVDKLVNVGKIKHQVLNGTFVHYPGFTIYNDIGNSSTIERLQFPLSKLLPNFEWINLGDSNSWIPLKITVASSYNGSCNYIWFTANNINKDNKQVFGTDIITNVHTDGVNIVFEFNKPVTRLKIIFSIL